MIMGRDRINSAMHNGRFHRGCMLIAIAVLLAPPAQAIGQEAETAPALSSTLHFSREIQPAVVELAPTFSDGLLTDDFMLRFDAESPVGIETDHGESPESSLSILAELTLLRVRSSSNEATSLDPAGSPHEVSLRFNDAQDAGTIWGDSANTAVGIDRWEVIPDLYIRSGQVHDAGYESLDYADLYAELGVDLSSNTGIWLRYERLRQALGSSREGEQVDADALYLQFELRF